MSEIDQPRDAMRQFLMSAEGAVAGTWGDVMADVALRAGFRCEYCGLDLLATHASYVSMEGDHVLPKSKYAKLDVFTPRVLALACSYCNKRKGRRDHPGGNETLADELLAGDERLRSWLVADWRRQLATERREAERRLALVRSGLADVQLGESFS